MTFIADIFMAAGAVGAAVYCLILSRRLKQFNQLESGMGGAIAVLSVQVDELTRALQQAQATATESTRKLDGQTARAEEAAKKMELLLASVVDLPDPVDAAGSRHGRVLRRRGADRVEAAE
jgi:hypothetical protein